MTSRKVSLVETLGRAARSVVSAATTSSRTQAGSRGLGSALGVLYVDRGIIVLNKPPGLVSQATAPSHRSTSGTGAKAVTSGRNDHPPASTFDDVLNGRSYASCRCDAGKKNDLIRARHTHTLGCMFIELRRRYDLSTNPYPVHRLDKVRRGGGKGDKGGLLGLTNIRSWLSTGNDRCSDSRAHQNLGPRTLTAIPYPCR
jgi:hypothetical protein